MRRRSTGATEPELLPIETGERFGEEWDTARFGEDPRAGNAAAAGGGQGGGGQGGGGGGEGGGGEGGGGQGGGGEDGGSAGAIAMAAAAIVNMVIGVVQYEDTAPTVFLRASTKLANAIQGLWRCKQEYDEAYSTYQEHKAWMLDRSHWQLWKRNGKSHDPLKFCNDSKTPPVKLCAFRDPILAKSHTDKVKQFEDPSRGILHCIREGFGTCGGELPASSWTPRLTAVEDVSNPNISKMGSIEQYRRYAVRYHEQVIGLDVYREFFLAAGLPLVPVPSVATEPVALKAMYPQPEYKADIDRGVLPFSMRNKLLGQALNLYRIDLVPGGFSIPLYLYDLSPAQQRATVFAPTMAQVADFAASRATPRQMGAGREQGAVTDVSADLGQWIQAGMPQQWGGRALSRPLPSPAAILADVPALVKPTFREAHPRLFWTGVAAGGVAGTGLAIWTGLKLAGR